MAAPRWRGRVVLDWSKDAGTTSEAQPCVLCRRPTTLISPGGKPCHKTCAEDWTGRREAAQ